MLHTAVCRLLDDERVYYTEQTTTPRMVNHKEVPARFFINFKVESQEYAIELPTDRDIYGYVHCHPRDGEGESVGYASGSDLLAAIDDIIGERC